MTTAIKKEIQKEVNVALREVLSDPEVSAELSTLFIQRLKTSIRSTKAGRTRDLRSYLKLKK
ncbi:MAG: hypothetical protein Q7S26_03185 [bacterium]|nr:hypothetical protein [bacterium]